MPDIEDSEGLQFPEDLPPVQPPSAGFIVQLFVVPALIVLAVVGVWLLFGKIAAGDPDPSGLLVELQHPNRDRRWRAAFELAQNLTFDQKNSDNDGERLSSRRDVATGLADALTAELKRGGSQPEELKLQAFLARTLGLVDVPDVVLPPLESAMRPEYDTDVRIDAVLAVGVLANRMAERRMKLDAPLAISSLLSVSSDELPLVRQSSAFALGLFTDPAVRERLEVMTADSDAMTRLNAAIGLARQHDVHGFGVFEEVLKTANRTSDAGSPAQFNQFLALKNCLAAVERLADDFTPGQRADLIVLLDPISSDFKEPRIRLSATDVLLTLKKGTVPTAVVR